MGQHLPQTSPGHEKPPDIAFTREEIPLTVRNPRASRTLIDINELSRRLSIAKGTLYNWVYLRRIPPPLQRGFRSALAHGGPRR